MEFYEGGMHFNVGYGKDDSGIPGWYSTSLPVGSDWFSHFHVYSMVYSEAGVSLFADGKLQVRAPKEELDTRASPLNPFAANGPAAHMQMHLNVALGGAGKQGVVTRASLPARMEVDYVRYFARLERPSPPAVPPIPARLPTPPKLPYIKPCWSDLEWAAGRSNLYPIWCAKVSAADCESYFVQRRDHTYSRCYATQPNENDKDPRACTMADERLRCPRDEAEMEDAQELKDEGEAEYDEEDAEDAANAPAPVATADLPPPQQAFHLHDNLPVAAMSGTMPLERLQADLRLGTAMPPPPEPTEGLSHPLLPSIEAGLVSGSGILGLLMSGVALRWLAWGACSRCRGRQASKGRREGMGLSKGYDSLRADETLVYL